MCPKPSQLVVPSMSKSSLCRVGVRMMEHTVSHRTPSHLHSPLGGSKKKKKKKSRPKKRKRKKSKSGSVPTKGDRRSTFLYPMARRTGLLEHDVSPLHGPDTRALFRRIWRQVIVRRLGACSMIRRLREPSLIYC